MKQIEEVSAYEVLEKRELPDIGSVGYLCRHKKTGARVALLSNNDENKVFYIGFRTPPKDSTGVAHILEHSVLCGSRDFPVKDPFIELLKGSLNTFLNAITYPDKTLYPVASCNDKDFQNLIHVYLDAVFYPRIYENEAIFRQEGWHYELDEETGELTYNGVVYNEMKGAYSSPEDVLDREIMNSLYPHTTYGYESGGDPEVIPELTYEQFLLFHRTYYHPSNSYLYLYGDMDMAQKLEWIDREYLAHFDALPVDSQVELEPAFQEPVERVREFPINPGEDVADNTFFAYNLSVADSLDRELYVAMQVLDYALCSAPGAPLKQALVDRGLGKDVHSSYDRSIRQPVFSVIAKGVESDRQQEFLEVVKQVLAQLAEGGLDKKALLAGINFYEFKYREADFGSTPKGLMFGIQMLDSWLYDESRPFWHLEENAVFGFLREKVEQGYFEGLLKRYFLENTHASFVVLKPVEGLLERREEALREALAQKKRDMDEEKLQEIRRTFADLNRFRDTPDDPEELAKIPMLSREDIKAEAEKLVYEKTSLQGTPALYHNLETNGVGYLRLIFQCRDIPGKYYPYMGLLKGCLFLLNTRHYTYGDLFNEINLYTGGMSAVNNVYGRADDPDGYTLTLEVKAKALSPYLGKAVELLEEVLLTSDFEDTKRLKEILEEGRSQMQDQMAARGAVVAMGRAGAYTSVPGAVSEAVTGIAFYREIARDAAEFESRKEQIVENLKALSRMIFRPENLMVDFVGEKAAFAGLEGPVGRLKAKLYTEPVERTFYEPSFSCTREGFLTSAQVQYVCQAGNFLKKGLPYRGELKVLRVMLEYEYLWVNVRVRGGAYGCACGFGRSGDSYFASYEDPNLGKTLEVYGQAADFVRDFQADERVMTQYILGAISGMDAPLTPAAKGLRALSAYMMGVTDEQLQRERDEVLAADPEKIRSLAAYVDAFLEDGCLCVVGNAQKLKREKKLFDRMENLF